MSRKTEKTLRFIGSEFIIEAAMKLNLSILFFFLFFQYFIFTKIYHIINFLNLVGIFTCATA